MLPSKRTTIILAIFVVALGLFLVYSYTKNSSTNYTNTASNALVVSTSSGINIGVTKMDADIKKELDDFNASKTTDETATATTSTEKLTATDVFSRNFFAQYVALKQQGVTITADNANQIASDYLKNAPLPTIQAKQYTADDIKLIDTNPTTLNTYQDSYISIFTKNWPTGQNSEVVILEKAVKNNNLNGASGLSTPIAIYEKALSAFLMVPVPKLAITEHLAVVNSLSTYIQTLKMIQTSATDPLSGYVAMNAFSTNQSNLVFSMANLRIYLINSLK